MAENWSKFEVEAAVEDYFNMLRLELSGQRYNKSRHRRELIGRLNNRSDGSVELKHQNISAVLIEMGVPYINGYKPRFNYQRTLLPTTVSRYLTEHPELHEFFQADIDITPQVPSVEDILSVLDLPPVKEKASTVAETPAVFNPTGVNYLEREAQNKVLGDAGEQFVINFERARLIHLGKESLADRIEQISITVGPSAGFDIHSFEKDGSDRFIEAKTTKYGKNTPFFLTSNELSFSQKNASRYYLYRVFKFRGSPRLFTLQGHLHESCVMRASQFLAWPK